MRLWSKDNGASKISPEGYPPNLSLCCFTGIFPPVFLRILPSFLLPTLLPPPLFFFFSLCPFLRQDHYVTLAVLELRVLHTQPSSCVSNH